MGSIDFLNPDYITIDENGEIVDWSEYYTEEEMQAFAHMSDDEIDEYDEASESYATLKARAFTILCQHKSKIHYSV